MKKACVFCASSQQIPQLYFDHARLLAKELVNAGYEVVYGGGALGLMGALADEVIRLDGRITGIIPRFMVEVEWEHKGVSNLIHVDTMAERKHLLVKEADVVVVLPGSTGTFEELFEVLSNKKLGIYTHPVILVNTLGFFDPFVTLLNNMVAQSFLRELHLSLVTVVNHPHEVVQAIHTAARWGENARALAAIREEKQQ